jgi:AAA domain
LSKILDYFAAKRPEEVFTPRSAFVNKTMYVNRPDYEKELRNAVRSKYHIVIFGDSGCGKSWLYKKIFGDLKITYETIDLSAVSNADEVDLLLLETVERGEEWRASEKTTENTTGVMPNDTGYQRKSGTTYVKQDDSAFVQLCAKVRRKAATHKAFIVFENLEHAISNKEVVKSLQAFLLALDDEVVAKLDVQICMIGVPADIKSLLSEGNKFQTIANRVVEVKEVTRMSKAEAKLLIFQGFRNELMMDMDNPEFIASQIIYLTDRIPQYLQDVCLQIAFVAEEEGSIVSMGAVSRGARNWLETNARQAKEFIDLILGHGKHRTDRKSRIIYAISKCELSYFYSQDIETILRTSFPNSVGDKRVQVMKYLNDLSTGEHRLLKKDVESGKFRIATPKLRSVLRYCLDIDARDEAVLVKSDE